MHEIAVFVRVSLFGNIPDARKRNHSSIPPVSNEPSISYTNATRYALILGTHTYAYAPMSIFLNPQFAHSWTHTLTRMMVRPNAHTKHASMRQPPVDILRSHHRRCGRNEKIYRFINGKHKQNGGIQCVCVFCECLLLYAKPEYHMRIARYALVFAMGMDQSEFLITHILIRSHSHLQIFDRKITRNHHRDVICSF